MLFENNTCSAASEFFTVPSNFKGYKPPIAEELENTFI